MKSRVSFIRIIAISLICTFLHQPVVRAQQVVQEYVFTHDDAILLTNQLLVAINPDSPENAYMPPYMKERIRWAFREQVAGRLKLLLVDDPENKLGSLVLMTSNYHEGLPLIEISARRLLVLIRVQQQTSSGFTRMQKNTFALGLAHEAAHLEQPKDYFERIRTSNEARQEEVRVWKKIDRLVVAKLLEIGEPLDIDLVDAHRILTKCEYSTNCPEFMEFMEGRRPKK